MTHDVCRVCAADHNDEINTNIFEIFQFLVCSAQIFAKITHSTSINDQPTSIWLDDDTWLVGMSFWQKNTCTTH